jgi:hypothetical protein
LLGSGHISGHAVQVLWKEGVAGELAFELIDDRSLLLVVERGREASFAGMDAGETGQGPPSVSTLQLDPGETGRDRERRFSIAMRDRIAVHIGQGRLSQRSRRNSHGVTINTSTVC